jgi:hypothetical protein
MLSLKLNRLPSCFSILKLFDQKWSQNLRSDSRVPLISGTTLLIFLKLMMCALDKIIIGEDDMCSTKKASVPFKVLLAGLLINLFFACAGVNPLSPGAWVEENDRIAVQDGGPHKGIWQTRDLTIDYEYREAARNIQVDGTLKLADYIPKGFSTLDYLRIYIHFLTSNGIVLETKSIKYFGYFRYLDYLGKMSFNSQFDLPENAVAFAFSYSGRASQGGGGPAGENATNSGQIAWDFWKVPRRSPPK